MSTGNRVRTRREQLGLTQAQLAQRVGKQRISVWRVENGVSKIKLDELGLWAKALRESKDTLLAWRLAS